MILIPYNQYKANLHSHSIYSDGRLTPGELKQAYSSHGYSILAITDHEHPVDHTDLSDDNFLMITGYEAYIRPDPNGHYNRYAPEVHLNLFAKDPHNIDLICADRKYIKYVKDPAEVETMPKYGPDTPRQYTPEYINFFIQTAADDGYLVAYNHPVWSLEDFSRLPLYKGIFSMEMCNYGSYVEGNPEYSSALYDRLLRAGIRWYTHSADDNHNGHPFGTPKCDSFGAFTMLYTENDKLDYDSVITSLEKGMFYSSMGPQIHYLEVQNGTAHIETSEAVKIVQLCGSKHPEVAYADSSDGVVTQADFKIPEQAEYIRFQVTDASGKCADTRGYFRDEIASALA